nr:hypothetical protein [uncultured Eisenbergiella sp.]
MQKPLRDIAGHLKNIVLSEIPESYPIKSIFTSISDEESIRKGVFAFRDFLYRLCDYLIINGDLFDKPKKIAHPFSDRVSLPSNYPFLHNMENVLESIGIHGRLNESSDLLAVDGDQFRADMAKTPTVRVIDCLRCLANNGFCISGINLIEDKVNMTDVETLVVSYPENSAILIGIKVMAQAKEEFEGTGLYGVILRCDYRVIANEELDSIYFLQDMAKPLPVENQKFIMKMHHKYMDDGFQCAVNIVDEMCIRFFYLYNRKEIWSIIISANNGYEIAIRAKHTDEYADIIKQFHPYLQEKISKGYGCDKKRDPNSYCQGGCKGFRISLTDSIISLGRDIETWIDAELSCL